MTNASTSSGDGVIVLLRDRVELVIVAASAGDRQPLKGLEGRIDLFVGDVHQELPAVPLVVRLGADGEETGGDHELRLVRVVPDG